ncbi:MAG: DUF58 domain-containing protein [Bacteroidetes bacterium]|nr:DUF58 domain-containing protein [Bacteroidota bacterium]MDA0903167.1 DUF58 domain-containing protein [Bacteroidota bacterium]MDA1242414.1 DUF58 domain-containing protein [Bacteroidota bacterium]
MDAAELLKRVRRVEITSRGLSDRIFAGEYHSAFKGRGMAFSENREYQAGDEVRTIDWNVTARTGTPHVKVFEEERELTVFLLIDISASIQGGTQERTMMDLATEVAAVLSFSAMGNNDKVGAILFTDRIEKFIPPAKGKSHTLRIVRDMLDCTPEGKGSDLGKALGHFTTALRKRTVAFVLSDFKHVDEAGELEVLLKRTRRKHDLVALHMTDPLDLTLPRLGWIRWKDPESGQMRWLRTGSSKVRQAWRARGESHHQSVARMMARAGVDHVALSTAGSFVQPLLRLFHERG